MRLFAGFLAQPFVTAVVTLLAFPVFFMNSEGGHFARGGSGEVMHAAAAMAIAMGIYAAAITALIVWPLAVWLTKRRDVDLTEALLFGLALGVLPYTLLALLFGAYGSAGYIRGVAYSAILGPAGAAAFWMIVLHHKRFDERPRAG